MADVGVVVRLLPTAVLSAYCRLPTAFCLLLLVPRRDSNPEPTDYESAALTVELQGHKFLTGQFTTRSASHWNNPNSILVILERATSL